MGTKKNKEKEIKETVLVLVVGQTVVFIEEMSFHDDGSGAEIDIPQGLEGVVLEVDEDEPASLVEFSIDGGKYQELIPNESLKAVEEEGPGKEGGDLNPEDLCDKCLDLKEGEELCPDCTVKAEKAAGKESPDLPPGKTEEDKEEIPAPEPPAETPIRDAWCDIHLVDIINCDSYRSCDIMKRRDQQRNGFETRIYQRLRTAGEGTGYCLMVYEPGTGDMDESLKRAKVIADFLDNPKNDKKAKKIMAIVEDN